MWPTSRVITLWNDAYFTCISNDVSGWYHNNNVLPHNAHVIYKGYLKISKANYDNDGYYICDASTDEGDQFKSRALLIVVSGMLLTFVKSAGHKIMLNMQIQIINCVLGMLQIIWRCTTSYEF